ncbi:transferrin-binding protein-like solute binding protein [Yoonia sp. R78084]|uniref:transferrin-binding protein-like solute binding protein n=1 Tax=Yoonia sp. R78084 TaxID=3093869 RepID=UPI0037DD4055
MNVYTSGPLIVAAFGLSACLGGGGGDGSPQPVSRTLAGNAALNAGSVAGSGSENGLPFAGGPDEITDEITLRFAHLVIDDTGQASVEITENSVILIENRQYLRLNGEVLEFTPTGDFFRATAADGTVYNISTSELLDENVQTINIDILETLADPAFTASSSRSIIGQQTDPELQDIILPETGSTLYAGVMEMTYTVADLDGTNAAATDDAGMVLTVNVRSDGTISGAMRSLEGGEFQVNNEDFNLEMSLTQTTLVGNGFGTSVNQLECVGICSGNSQIGGVFYGENAENLAGVFLLDETLESENARLMGVGNYNFLSRERFNPD